MAHYDIVIIGAGMAGASLACALADSGFCTAIVDAGPVPVSKPVRADSVAAMDLRVVALAPASQTLLQQLGVWADIEVLGVSAYTDMQVWDADGTGNIAFDAASVAADRLGVIVENRSIIWALQRRLQAAGVAIYASSPVSTMQHHKTGWRLSLGDGQHLQAGLLVGADGARSRVRQAAGITSRVVNNNQQAIVCNVRTTMPHHNVARQRFLPTGPLAFLPAAAVGEAVCSVVWSCSSAIAEQYLALSDADFKTALGNAFEMRLGPIVELSPRLGFPLLAQHAASYSGPALALIGDAAHVLHPLAGQGINLGFGDVQALAEALHYAARTGLAVGNKRVLARYQRQRRGITLRMLAVTQGLNYLFGARALPLRWLRNEGLRQLDSQPYARQAIIRQAMGV